MSTLRKFFVLSAGLACFGNAFNLEAAESENSFQPSLAMQFVESIDSVEKAKAELQLAFTARDSCAFGSCHKGFSILICEIVAAVDENTGGRVLQEQHDQGDYDIAPEDAKNMRMLFSQCKPSSYQYWNDNQVLHVAYLPDKNVDAKVRAYLGVKKKTK